MVTSRAVHAVLLESDADGLRVVRRFSRQRTSRLGSGGSGLPDVQESETSSDFTLQIGDDTGGGEENMFLGSEFGALDVGGEGSGPGGQEGPSTFVLELGDILAECRDAGYPNPSLAFSLSAAEVNQQEILLPQDTGKSKPRDDSAFSRVSRLGKDKDADTGSTSRSQLLELLKGHHKGPVKDECVAFLPMTPTEEGMQRYLAVFPRVDDPVAETVRQMREQEGRRMPSIRLLDSEVPLYLGLGRAAINLSDSPGGAEAQSTLIVRAGSEDTLALFIEGNVLQQSENLRSLTAYEAPETICSRILLLQDEYGIGDVDHVLLLSEEREDDLIDSFEMFFPDARVESLRGYVPQVVSEEVQEVPSGMTVPAVGVGLRLVDDPRYQGVFEDVNLLPKKLLRRKLNLPVSWHVIALYIVLFCTVLFFVARFFKMESEIAEHRRNIQQMQAQSGSVPAHITDANTLQQRIDSLQGLHEQYMNALDVLEGLLRGSDMWSRALEKTSRQVNKVSGIWIESWNPRGNSVQLVGNSMERQRVVELAERLDANISSLTFSEIREWPVYSFEMDVPLENALPEAAQFLRQQAVASDTARTDSLPVTPASLGNQSP
jgi:Tfp pilus assembly protein PilN